MASSGFIDVNFNGLDSTIKKMEQIKDNIKSGLDRIMLQAALILEAEVKKQITNMELVDTGTLRASVFSFVRKRFGYTDGVVGIPVEYAPFLEYGTGQRGAESNYPDLPADYHYGDSPGITAYKYMHTAWENSKGKIVAFVRMELRKLVNVDAQVAATFGN